ncbi:MAG: hypothetical protein ABJC66_06470 [Gammaproteobacteria bacterium]
MPWAPVHGPNEQAVVDAMRNVRFSAMGSVRSYWDFYQGFGIALSGLLAVQAVLLWQLANVARDGGRYRAMLATHLAGFLFNAVVIGAYIFVLPLAFTLAIALCLLWAFVRRDDAKASNDEWPKLSGRTA